MWHPNFSIDEREKADRNIDIYMITKKKSIGTLRKPIHKLTTRFHRKLKKS